MLQNQLDLKAIEKQICPQCQITRPHCHCKCPYCGNPECVCDFNQR